ncbi:MAG: hypothetical protein K9M75_02270 [Phycisphaerae bacterium]|nr:hypothetical protein [Phycisphaerae bacterium]
MKLQEKTTALPGTVESYWFENEHIGLKKTLFHRVSIPLEAFNSGLEYEEQPVETTIEFEWFNLGLSDPGNLNDINMSNEIYPEGEASVYVGNAHNWCDVKKLLFTSVGDNKFKVEGELFIKFEIEGVAKNEDFNFETTVTYHQIGHE